MLGTQKVGKLLLQAALKNFNQRRLLHGLGFYLSVNEWMEDAEKFVVDDTCDVKKDEISCIKGKISLGLRIVYHETDTKSGTNQTRVRNTVILSKN